MHHRLQFLISVGICTLGNLLAVPLFAEDDEIQFAAAAWNRAVPAEQRNELQRNLKFMSQRLWIAIKEPNSQVREELFHQTATQIWTRSEQVHTACAKSVPLIEPFFFATGPDFMNLWEKFNQNPTNFLLKFADMTPQAEMLARNWLLAELNLPQEYHFFYTEGLKRYLRSHGLDPVNSQRDAQRYAWCLRQYRGPFDFEGFNLPALKYNLQILTATRTKYATVKRLRQNAQTLLFHQWIMYRGLEMFRQPKLVHPTIEALEDKLNQIQNFLSIALSSDTEMPQKHYFAKLVSEMQQLAQEQAGIAQNDQLFDDAQTLTTISMKFGQEWLRNDQKEMAYQVWLSGLTPEQLTDPALLDFQLEYFLRNPPEKSASRKSDSHSKPERMRGNKRQRERNSRGYGRNTQQADSADREQLPVPPLPACMKDMPGKEMMPYLLSYNYRVYLTDDNRKRSYKKLQDYKSQMKIFCNYLSQLKRAAANCRARQQCGGKRIGAGMSAVKPGTTDYRPKASDLSDLNSGRRKN